MFVNNSPDKTKSLNILIMMTMKEHLKRTDLSPHKPENNQQVSMIEIANCTKLIMRVIIADNLCMKNLNHVRNRSMTLIMIKNLTSRKITLR